MTETSHTVEDTDQLPFDQKQIAEFDADDVTAGRAIGKMLAFFFLYTVIVMAIAALWTFNAISG